MNNQLYLDSQGKVFGSTTFEMKLGDPAPRPFSEATQQFVDMTTDHSYDPTLLHYHHDLGFGPKDAERNKCIFTGQWMYKDPTTKKFYNVFMTPEDREDRRNDIKRGIGETINTPYGDFVRDSYLWQWATYTYSCHHNNQYNSLTTNEKDIHKAYRLWVEKVKEQAGGDEIEFMEVDDKIEIMRAVNKSGFKQFNYN